MSKEITIREGVLVYHPKKPEWGLGKVLDVRTGCATIFFKEDSSDCRTIMLDKVDLQIAEVQSDPFLDSLPPFVNGTFKTEARRVSIQDGIKAFTARFPGGFSDPKYLEVSGKEMGGERNYKVRAHKRYKNTFGGGRGEIMLANDKLDELRAGALDIATKDQMNMLSPYEAMAFRDGLAASDEAACKYFRSLFEFVKRGPSQESFNALSSAVSSLPVQQGRARVATWPVLTLLPFLSDPERFMFLKPEPTRACAARLRFELLYDSTLNWATYERLLSMGRVLLGELKHLGPRDFIDVQSFMWVIQKY